MSRNRHGKVFPRRFCRVVLAVAADHPRCSRWCVCKGWSDCTLGVRGRNVRPCRKNTTEMQLRPVSELPRKGVSVAIPTGRSDDSPKCPRWCVCKGWSNCTLGVRGRNIRPCRKNTTEIPFRSVSETPWKSAFVTIPTGPSDDFPKCPRCATYRCNSLQ